MSAPPPAPSPPVLPGSGRPDADPSVPEPPPSEPPLAPPTLAPLGPLPPGPVPRAVVAIPARNEAETIGDCLAALAGQTGADGDAPLPPGSFGVVVLANNTTDATVAICRALAPALPFPLLLLDLTLATPHAHAGWARRLAMEAAAEWLARGAADGRPPSDAVLLTTDADGRPAPGWVSNSLAALAAGADAVLGAVTVDPAEHAAVLPPCVRERGAREEDYAALLDELAARLDPVPWDPWPRHDCEPGASIALTLDAWRRVGGVPPLPIGEDRALCAALRRIDARLRHAPEVSVEVSCRLEGRATGGMADTMRRRIAVSESPLDDRLEPARDAWRRHRARAALRRLWGAGRVAPDGALGRLARRLGLPAADLARLLDGPRFGTVCEAVELASPVLSPRRPVPPETLAAETRRAAAMVSRLRTRRDGRRRAGAPGEADPAGIPDAAPVAGLA
ncbi:glycosyltransferase family 2 protein [Roseomonas sp. NAR14]|uniref:Glycosyltransferase family 2 protein n=1 Tax=Roseomonas acroporae TaxID=2937791 RepID=A0A9X2BW22_9PROT|nr:glycosyltransferase family A protein [Roseomonas acroporae]MCK8783375.1 glycosyltransferase family 2 protein [Roseomonas acroporae]